MNSTKAVEFRAYQNARKVVAQNTRKSMSKSQKLETCFRWVMKRYYRTWRRFSQGGKAWYAVNANDHFERGCGDCIADASAFAYLAKALGYKNVYVCTDGYRNDENSHGWTEINGRVYDPLFAVLFVATAALALSVVTGTAISSAHINTINIFLYLFIFISYPLNLYLRQSSHASPETMGNPHILLRNFGCSFWLLQKAGHKHGR